MTREEIEQQAEHFFTWPTDDRTCVTYTSALLFAEHCVKEATKEESDLLTIAYMDGIRQGQIDRLGGK